MVLNERMNAFCELGAFLRQFKATGYEKVETVKHTNVFYDSMVEKIQSAKHYNGWFTEDNVLFAINQWGNLLTKDNLEHWMSRYDITNIPEKTIGVIMAGNIPLVGFHDFLSVLISGHSIIIKQSSNDNYLLPLIISYLKKIEPRFEDKINVTTERFSSFDAVIATGSNNTARYFEQYFGNKPNIIRKNRNSVAVLSGTESKENLIQLGDDIFRYYGLGCRSVSKLFLPKGYNFDVFFDAMYLYNEVINGSKYANNYDYNKAIYLMSSYKLLDNGFLMLKEDAEYSSPIATLFYEYYENDHELKTILQDDGQKIQCIVGHSNCTNNVNFGETQKPMLHNYADNIDVVDFLTKIS